MLFLILSCVDMPTLNVDCRGRLYKNALQIINPSFRSLHSSCKVLLQKNTDIFLYQLTNIFRNSIGNESKEIPFVVPSIRNRSLNRGDSVASESDRSLHLSHGSSQICFMKTITQSNSWSFSHLLEEYVAMVKSQPS